MTIKKLIKKNYYRSCIEFGHSKREWNPKITPYLLNKKKFFHTINLAKASNFLKLAANILKKRAEKGEKFLFVGTNDLTSPILLDEAIRINHFYINSRWLGGMLTNWPTLQKRVNRLLFLEELEANGKLNSIAKKNFYIVKQEINKLNKLFKGIKKMKTFPNVIIFIDSLKNSSAINECLKLGIPTVTLVDTNCNPEISPFIIPSNNDSIFSIKFLLNYLGEKILAGNLIYEKKKILIQKEV
jgi:small subunit ribosomal protein S2